MPPQKPAIQSDTGAKTDLAAPAISKFRLSAILIVPFVLQVITVVGLVSYLYVRNEQRAVDDICLSTIPGA